MKLCMNFTNSISNPKPQSVNFTTQQVRTPTFNMQSIMNMRVSSCKSCGK